MKAKLGALSTIEIIEKFLQGWPIQSIAKTYNCYNGYISQIVTAYLDMQSKIDKAKIKLAMDGEDLVTEFDLLKMPNNRFYEHTKLDPNNRWWVNKGKMI